MKQGEYFGIDFGTTNTTVTRIIVEEHGTTITQLGENHSTDPFPSIVAIPKEKDDNMLLFGNEVRKKLDSLLETHNIYTSMKSYLGTKKIFSSGDNTYSAKEVTTAFFKYIKKNIKDNYSFTISKASLSFPVDFPPEARRELLQSLETARIDVNYLVNEATSSYISNKNNDKLKSATNTMVIDWGGGTLDVSILNKTVETDKIKLSEIAIYGQHFGGDNIDYEIAKYLHNQMLDNYTDMERKIFDEMSAQDQYKLKIKSEEAKINFLDDDENPMSIRNYASLGTKKISITSEKFTELIKPVLNENILPTIKEALKRADMTPINIDAVIVVGGSSNIKPFQNMITNFFGKDKIIIPDDARYDASNGACYIDIIGGNFKLSKSLGILLSDDTIYPILEKDIDGVLSNQYDEEQKQFVFSLSEDSQTANFIFIDETFNTYKRVTIDTKGYFDERLELTAKISKEQIAYINILNKTTNKENKIEITKLPFYYDLSLLDDRKMIER